ncbi:MAG: SDR family oxidoreductase [Deltaproteobacteria bacterium]|nr:SDR family oxidoreductase [Deltaproteobacteria bacterium]
MSRFDGKAVVVTGAASGLGRATSLAYAEEGASLMLLDVNTERLEATAQEARALGAETKTAHCDISDPHACRDAIAMCTSAHGGVDVLSNVAGIVGFFHARDVTPEEWSRFLGINLNGPFFLYQAAIASLIERGGNILNVASSAAFVGEAYLVPYATSKAALVHLTKSLAMEHMHDGIRINAIAPGGMMTPMGETVSIPDGVKGDLIGRYTGIRAPSTPEEVAELILYVTSDRAPSIHGACLSIDTGITAG